MVPPDVDFINSILPCFDLRKSKHIAIVFHAKVFLFSVSNTHPWHAEELAIRKLCMFYSQLKGQIHMFLTRIGVNQNARPCACCCACLKRFYPKLRVFFSDENGIWHEEITFDNKHLARRRTKRSIF